MILRPKRETLPISRNSKQGVYKCRLTHQVYDGELLDVYLTDPSGKRCDLKDIYTLDWEPASVYSRPCTGSLLEFPVSYHTDLTGYTLTAAYLYGHYYPITKVTEHPFDTSLVVDLTEGYFKHDTRVTVSNITLHHRDTDCAFNFDRGATVIFKSLSPEDRQNLYFNIPCYQDTPELFQTLQLSGVSFEVKYYNKELTITPGLSGQDAHECDRLSFDYSLE